MKVLESARECVQANMIAWVQYPNNMNRECFVYPQYLKKDGVWFAINSGAFPNNGSFLAFVTGASDAQQINEQYGSLVVARVNIPKFEENFRYEATRDISSKFKVAINPDFHRGNSDLEFEIFSETSFSSDLVQIISANSSLCSQISPDNSLLRIDSRSHEPVCQNILLRVQEQGQEVLYGPFGYNRRESGMLNVHALANYDYRVGRFTSIEDYDCMTVRDKEGKEVTSFVGLGELQTVFYQLEQSDLIDWLPRNELISEVCRAVSSSNDFKALGKSQLRQIKAAIVSCSEAATGLRLDEQRRNRMQDAILQMEDMLTLDDTVLQAIVDRVDDDRLARLVADDRLFPEIQERLMENAGIKEKIDEEKKRLEQRLEGLNEEIEKLSETREQLNAEVKAARVKVEEVKRESARIEEEALSKRSEELCKLDREIDERREECTKATEERDQIIHQRLQAQEAFNKVFDGINDEVAASTKILESEVLRKVVAKVSESELPSEDNIAKFEPDLPLRDSQGCEPNQVVEELYESITDYFGRDSDYNDIVNYMICLTQGYITTFAGLPGTGKTSLCNILGEALGLKSQQYGERFVEINVESGWTSYKDYVGYYNPLSRRYEKANARVYNAMNALSKENEVQASYPPFVFLLDEANLSSMEHYWSPFLRSCDCFDSAGTILSLGGSENWTLPSHLRFLATVNFDHTTEALSPRFLDRSWIITLGFSSIDVDDVLGESAETDRDFIPFSYNGLLKVFGKRNRVSISAPVKSLYDRLLRVCRDHSFSVSPRSQAMILHYVTVAEELMKTDSRDSQFAPLDYAISQKVLPMISGPAEVVDGLILELENECSPLQITRSHLKRMMRQGEDSGFYQFFA